MSDRGEASEVTRVLLWLLVALILAFAILGVVMSFGMGWGYGMMGMGFGWMGLLMAIPAIVLVLILLVVLGAFDRTYPSRDRALESLDIRLAKGEVSLEEYKRLKEELRR